MSDTTEFDKILTASRPHDDKGWIEYAILKLWEETDGFENIENAAAIEIADLRAENERLKEELNFFHRQFPTAAKRYKAVVKGDA